MDREQLINLRERVEADNLRLFKENPESYDFKSAPLFVEEDEDGLTLMQLIDLALKGLDEWEPIETAPRDGAPILVDFGPIGIHRVAWEEPEYADWESWCVDDRKHGPYALRGYQDEFIKGWKPLPTPPKEGGE